MTSVWPSTRWPAASYCCTNIASKEPSREALSERFREYSDRSDVEGVFRLVYWHGVSEADRGTLRRSLEVDFRERIKSVEVVPLSEGYLLEYTRNGITYRPNLQVVGELVVTFEPRDKLEPSADGSFLVPPSTTTYLVGRKDGRYSIAMAAPAEKSAE